MKYLNFDVLNKIDAQKYQDNKPFPFIDFPNALYDDAYALLVKTAPDVSLFENQFGIERKYGQKFHDKYFLEYFDTTPVASPWKEFAAELYSDEYRRFIERMFKMKRGSYNLVLSWHYMTRGTCITPHCDTEKKIGSQLFYLNTSDKWEEEWGGQTLALDDEGKRNPESGPEIAEFNNIFKSKSVDNSSFIFTRTNHSWHAVDVIQCPPDEIRKMFSIVANRKPSFYRRIKNRIKKLLG